MQTVETIISPTVLPDNQRDALISLLADDDPDIYRMVRNKLLSYGQLAVEWVRPYTLSNEPAMRRRAMEIVEHLNRQFNDERFLEFCQRSGQDLDLEEATGLLAQTKYPGANPEAYRALYDQWAEEIRLRLRPTQDPEQILGEINYCLFGELGFSGHDQYAYDPTCCYLNRIVDRRSGNPIGICAIYLFLTRRLRLPVAGIGLPGHFVCRYQSSTKEVYIDCFRKGIFLTKADCIKYLFRANLGVAEGHLLPVNPKRILLRMCNNLHVTYAHLEMAEEAARVQRYVNLLAR
jgi:regulator of sirC expression with transglutaminase-like and TPR domain